MMQRIRKSMEEKDQGFTLIELLVVIIIIGILSAIAIPIFLNQRKKAVDAAARADLTTVAKQIATYYVDNTATLTVDIAGAAPAEYYEFTSTDLTAAENVGPVSGELQGKASIVNTGSDASNFEVTLTYSGGTLASISYNGASGLQDGPAAP